MTELRNYKGSIAPMYLQKENIKSLLYPFIAKNAKRCRNINRSELKKLGKQQKEETAWYFYKDMKLAVCINKEGNYHSSEDGQPAWISYSGDCQFFTNGDIVMPDKPLYANHYHKFLVRFFASMKLDEKTGEVSFSKSAWFSN